jgi:hypothetical protein
MSSNPAPPTRFFGNCPGPPLFSIPTCRAKLPALKERGARPAAFESVESVNRPAAMTKGTVRM